MDLVSVGESGARCSARAAFYSVCGLLFAISVGATIAACLSMSAMGELPMHGGWSLSMMWMPMCGQTWPRVAASFVGMWIAMMTAMMLPSVAPVLWRYREALGSARHGRASTLTWMTWLAGIGYFAIWAALGAVVFALGAAFAALQMQVPALSHAVPVIAGVMVLLAGALQSSAWKAHYLDCCRQPQECGHAVLPLRSDAALRYGLRLGLHCCYCCASFTAVLVAIGVMDLLAMAALTVAITLERLAPRGPLVARGFGYSIVGTGLLMIVRAAWLM
jgi:predicted metal-binding membrane protein